MKIRKFIQFTPDLMPDESISSTALADDGTLWAANNKNSWWYIGCVPQIKEPQYLSLYTSNEKDKKDEN